MEILSENKIRTRKYLCSNSLIYIYRNSSIKPLRIIAAHTIVLRHFVGTNTFDLRNKIDESKILRFIKFNFSYSSAAND